MLTTQTMDCPVCDGLAALTITYHRHGIEAADGTALVSVESYLCRLNNCSIPYDDLLSRRAP